MIPAVQNEKPRLSGAFRPEVGQFPNAARRAIAARKARRLYSRPARCVQPEPDAWTRNVLGRQPAGSNGSASTGGLVSRGAPRPRGAPAA
jgi:hypothetical protein